VVVAVGPGKVEKGEKTEMQVKEGDKVIYSKYAGTEVKYGDEEYIIVTQNDIIAIVE
jgi:chaperonin GroES